MSRYNDELEECAALMDTPEAKNLLFGWPEPKGFVSPTPFPLDCLPDDLREYVKANAETNQLAPDMVALFALGLLGLVCTGCYADGVMHEPMQLYVCCIAAPGEGKSRSLRPMRAPVDRWISDENERRKVEVRVTAKELEDAKTEERMLKRTASRSERIAAAQKVADCEKALVLPFPVPGTDATPAAVEDDMQKYGGKFFLMATEGATLANLSGQNTKDGRTNVDVINSAFDGDGVHTRRVSRESVNVEHAHGAILIAVQPSAVQSFLHNKDLNGNGLLSRFLFAQPPSMIGTRKLLGNAPMPRRVAEAFDKRMYAICNEVMNSGKTFTCQPDAVTVLASYYDDVESQLSNAGILTNVFDGWGARCAPKALRISGLLAAWEGLDQITAKNMRAAVTIMQYFTTQALLLCGFGGTLGDEASALLDKIIEKKWRSFAVKDIKRGTRRRQIFEAAANDKERAKRYSAGIVELTEAGYIRVKEQARCNDHDPNTVYEVNPRVYELVESSALEVTEI